jgi:membrane-bound ClpP family serine protease
MNQLDVRIPIGGMFTIFGVVLIVYGLVSDKAMYARSLGINVNLWWGLVLLAFGLVMLGLAYRAHRARARPPQPGQDPRPPAV